MKALLTTWAALALIPVLVLIANLAWFAFTGAGFLPEATGAVQSSRAAVGWLFGGVSVALFAFAMTY